MGRGNKGVGGQGGWGGARRGLGTRRMGRGNQGVEDKEEGE